MSAEKLLIRAPERTEEDCYRLPELENLALATLEFSNTFEDPDFGYSEDNERTLVEIPEVLTDDFRMDEPILPVWAFQSYYPLPDKAFFE